MAEKRRGVWERLWSRLRGRRGKEKEEKSTQRSESALSPLASTEPARPPERALTRREVEALGLEGRWLQVVEEAGQKKTVWVNAEPRGGLVMEVRDGPRGWKLGIVPQPQEAACFSHSPPDQSLAAYNSRRWDRFLRHYAKRFTPLLSRKVGNRAEDFYRIHHDGLRIPPDATARKSARRAARRTRGSQPNTPTPTPRPSNSSLTPN